MLEKLVYQSRAHNDAGSLSLFSLLTRARLKNARLNITGYLVFDGELYTQWIEGPPQSVQSLWESLNNDERHSEITLISRGPVAERRFPSWSMAFSSYASFNGHHLPGFFLADEHTIKDKIAELTA